MPTAGCKRRRERRRERLTHWNLLHACSTFIERVRDTIHTIVTIATLIYYSRLKSVEGRKEWRREREREGEGRAFLTHHY